MTTHSDHRREPLSPEEQALARRLAQWHAGEPAPALDRKILAEARSALVVRPPVRHVRRPWLLGVASAATGVFALGLIWQVADQAPEPQVDRAAEVAPVPVPAPSGQVRDSTTQPVTHDDTAIMLERTVVAAPPAPPAPPARATVSADAEKSAREAALAPSPRAPSETGTEQRAPAALAPPSQMALPAPPPPIPAEPEVAPSVAAPAATAPVRERSSSGAGNERQRFPVARRAITEAAPAPARPDSPGPSPADGDSGSAGPGPALGGIASDPAESAEFRQAIREIRRLVARDQHQSALTAIERLRRKHPDQPLPDDLNTWLTSREGEP